MNEKWGFDQPAGFKFSYVQRFKSNCAGRKNIWAASWQNQQNWHVRPAKTQISLGICPVWSESSLSTWRKLGSLATNWACSEDSDLTGWMPRLIWVFAGCTCHFVGFVMRWLILFGSAVYCLTILVLLPYSQDNRWTSVEKMYRHQMIIIIM